MSSALINRSLTTVKTELEFLCDSDVITKDLYQQLVTSLPEKYHKDMAPWDVGVDKVDKDVGNTDTKQEKQETIPQAAPQAAPQAPETAIGYCKALYSFQSQQSDDLSFNKDELLCVKQHLSPDWWKGYRKNDPHTEGVFPSNYVQGISYQEYSGTGSSLSSGLSSGPNEKANYGPNEKADYGPSAPYQYPTPSNSSNHSVPSYSQPDYSQFPPPSTNYYQNQNQQQPQQYQNQQGQTIVEHNGANQGHMRKFGGKLGNAAIFGAGATIGSDIVNSIF